MEFKISVIMWLQCIFQFWKLLWKLFWINKPVNNSLTVKIEKADSNFCCIESEINEKHSIFY